MIARIASLCAMMLAVASSASAQETVPTVPTENAFARAEFQVDPTAVHLALEANGDVGEPRIRTESGFVRIWFPGMAGWMNIDLDGDGSAIRFVRVRPGADDTGVVVLRVGDARRVSVASVGVARAGNRVVVTIARSALPPVFEALPPPAPVVAPVPQPVAEAAPAEVVEASTPEPSDGPRSAADALADPEPVPQEPIALGIPTAEGPSTLTMLLAISALLALALGAVHWMRSRTPGAAQAHSIRIVASTRLSPKQQLVVVRALGQDHLIALEPGRTERLLSIPCIDAPARVDDEPVPELRLSRPSLALVGQGAAASASFGAELMRMIDPKNTARATAPTAMAPAPMPSTSNSEAVAGLVRLRAAAR